MNLKVLFCMVESFCDKLFKVFHNVSCAATIRGLSGINNEKSCEEKIEYLSFFARHLHL